MKLICVLFILISFTVFANQASKNIFDFTKFNTKTYSVNLKNTLTNDFVNYIAKEANLNPIFHTPLSGKVSYSFDKASLNHVLKRIADDNGIKFEIKDGELHIYGKKGSSSQLKNSDKKQETNDILGKIKEAKIAGSLSAIEAEEIEQTLEIVDINYANAEILVKNLNEFLKDKKMKIIFDKEANSIGVLSDKETFRIIKKYIKHYDKRPKQILIEAKIVEISENFNLNIGANIGHLGNAQLELGNSKVTGLTQNVAIGNQNGLLGLKFGTLDGRLLTGQLALAESTGEAKIISRPRVITLNRQQANIQSGITFNIKTAAPTGTSAGEPGGLTEIVAGLTLNVLPEIVGNNRIKLKIDVTNSEPDQSIAVDSIPGIVDNKASTVLIVKNGETATMAGLIKNSFSKTKNGVPGLSDIPIFGWFFKNEEERDKKNELMIFITPSIVNEDVVALRPVD